MNPFVKVSIFCTAKTIRLYDVFAVITCQRLPSPGNGSVFYSNFSESIISGTVATYQCNLGFALVGDVNATCVGNGRNVFGVWTSNESSCERKNDLLG